MRFTNLFDGPFHNCLSEDSKKEVDDEHTKWLIDVGKFFMCGLIIGIIIGILI